MRINFFWGIAILFSVTMSVACSQVPAVPAVSKQTIMLNQTVPGSYIVNAPGDGESVIRRVFVEYDVLIVRSLGNEQFELRLNRDPGLEALKSTVSKSDGAVTAIQPNFVYHTF